MFYFCLALEKDNRSVLLGVDEWLDGRGGVGGLLIGCTICMGVGRTTIFHASLTLAVAVASDSPNPRCWHEYQMMQSIRTVICHAPVTLAVLPGYQITLCPTKWNHKNCHLPCLTHPSFAICVCVYTSQMMTWVSNDAVANRVPSGEKSHWTTSL